MNISPTHCPAFIIKKENYILKIALHDCQVTNDDATNRVLIKRKKKRSSNQNLPFKNIDNVISEIYPTYVRLTSKGTYLNRKIDLSKQHHKNN